ncbi:MAG: chloride channel protein [Flexilinea sp.]|nr:chloride channel protein [Flexilinea sp.]
MNNVREYLNHLLIYVRALAKWLLVSSIVGLVCGLLGSAFHIGVEKATLFRETHHWVIYTLPLAGLLAGAIYKLLRAEGLSTNDILSEIQNGNGISPTLLPAIFLTTVLTHLAGGSAGREGAALQMGGSIGYGTGKLLRLDDRDLRTATMTGMAAFFSALFGTPLAAAVFSMGVVSVGLVYHAAFIPCFIASLAAYGVSLILGVSPTRFSVAAPAVTLPMMLRVAVLAAFCGFLSVIFCEVLHLTERQLHKQIPNRWLRAFLGGAALLGLTLLVRCGDYNGAGMGVITAAVEEGRAVPAAFLWKILFTAITLAVGFKGGEVVPSFFVGAAFGCVAGPVLGIPAGFAAAVGLTAVFCGAVNCPIASIFLAIELFGAEGMLYFALACGLSFILSGYSGLYSSQRILYDKLKARFIDVHANAYHEK